MAIGLSTLTEHGFSNPPLRTNAGTDRNESWNWGRVELDRGVGVVSQLLTFESCDPLEKFPAESQTACCFSLAFGVKYNPRKGQPITYPAGRKKMRNAKGGISKYPLFIHHAILSKKLCVFASPRPCEKK
jgi:hypothetical protein